MMDTIIREAELHLNEWGGHIDILDSRIFNDDVVTISRAAKVMVEDQDVKAIVVFTLSGMSALWMSKTKPSVPIYAFTPETRTYQWLGICRGVTALRVPPTLIRLKRW